MKLSTLLQDQFSTVSAPDTDITLVTERAEKADASSIFVCICGANFDGHSLAPVAYANGCRVFVAQKELALPTDALVLVCDNTRAALAHLACAFYGDPSHEMRLIGITGTKGKTTTAQLLSHILNRNGIPCGYIGTNGISYADVTRPTRNTTPDAITLQQTLCEMHAAGVSTAVIEVSSQALMQRRADGIRFTGVLFTNLFPDHIGPNEHTDLADYTACKRRLFTDFDATHAIFNADDAITPAMARATTAERPILCSIKDRDAAFFADHIELLGADEGLGVRFEVRKGNETHICVLPLIGSVNVSNALLALATANEVFGIDLFNAARTLSDATVAGRSELIPLANGACVVIDYAHNGASLRQLLTTLREYAPTRLITLFGSIGGRAQLRRRDLGVAAAELSDLAILTSDNPCYEDPDAIINEIATAFEGSPTPYVQITDRAQAIRYALGLLRTGDILVLAGKGHENYQLVGDEKRSFCERSIVMEELKREALKAQ